MRPSSAPRWLFCGTYRLHFNVCVYRSRYSDLNNAFGDDLSAYYSHYISYGFGEGRTAV